MELYEKETNILRSDTVLVDYVHANGNHYKKSKKKVFGNKNAHSTNETQIQVKVEQNKNIKGECYRCGIKDHRASKCSFAEKLTYNHCGKRGHLEKVCLTKTGTIHKFLKS